MPGLTFYEKVLFSLQIAALGGVLVRFLASGLVRVYSYFFVYLIVQCVQLSIPLLATQGTNPYALLYFATEGTILCLYVLIVLELYSIVLRDLRGIASLAKRYIKVSIAIAIGLSLLLVRSGQIRPGVLPVFLDFERFAVGSLVVFVLLITAFLVYYPIPLHANVTYYTIGYAFYFSTKAIALFVRNTGQEWWQRIDLILLAASTLCLIFWTFSLSRQGEHRVMTGGTRWSRDDEEKVLARLNAINASLVRARK